MPKGTARAATSNGQVFKNARVTLTVFFFVAPLGLRRTKLKVFLTKSERRSKWSDVNEDFF
jgi:hypothetical protein